MIVDSFKYKDANTKKTNVVELHAASGKLGDLHEVMIKSRDKVLSIKSFNDEKTAESMFNTLKQTLT